MFKKLLARIILFCFAIAHCNAQEQQKVSVEKSLWGVQTGFFGVWGFNELKLSNSIALRSEVGLTGGFGVGSRTGGRFIYILTPSFGAESRWYRNLNRRVRKGKSIAGNSADFLSVKAVVIPDFFNVANFDNAEVESNVSTTFNGGMRRVIGKHFTYELGLGFGALFEFRKDFEYDQTVYFVPDFHVRLGYTF